MAKNQWGFTGVISPRNKWSYFGPLYLCHWLTSGRIACIYVSTHLKFNSSPLKSYLPIIGKACLPTTIFQGLCCLMLFKLRGCKLPINTYQLVNSISSTAVPRFNSDSFNSRRFSLFSPPFRPISTSQVGRVGGVHRAFRGETRWLCRSLSSVPGSAWKPRESGWLNRGSTKNIVAIKFGTLGGVEIDRYIYIYEGTYFHIYLSYVCIRDTIWS